MAEGSAQPPRRMAPDGQVAASAPVRAHARLKPHGPLGRLCLAGPTPVSVRGLRGEADPPRGSPSFFIVALEKSTGGCKAMRRRSGAGGKEAIREQWRLGEEKGAVDSVATVTLWWSWSRAGEETEGLQGSPPAQPGVVSAHLHESSRRTPT